jgi:REP element-mobilizing transposase RayT
MDIFYAIDAGENGMTLPRNRLISLDLTPYYHCVSRCVRRAFLCGKDPVSGKNYEHRREWLEDRILYLAKYFCVQVAAYAVMSNHYHIVLKIDKDAAINLSPKEVIEHWQGMFNGTPLSNKYLKEPESLSEPESTALLKQIEIWRARLYDISWFMRCINEFIAKKANRKDKCTGRFWEGRFKSQALLDEKAVIACMAYVDLNPIRAGISKQPANSSFTSVKKRTQLRKDDPDNCLSSNVMVPLSDDECADMADIKQDRIHCTLDEYKDLLKWTAKFIHKKSKGKSSYKVKVGEVVFSSTHIYEMTHKFEKLFRSLVGTRSSYLKKYRNFKFKKQTGLLNCEKYFE